MNLYLEHIYTVRERFDEALAAQGFDSVLIFAGQPAVAFLDDNAYPFRVNPFFKYWVPVTDSPKSFIFYEPGKEPQLFLFQARDFWHAQPVVPPGDWQEHVEVVPIDSMHIVGERVAKEFGKTAFIGESFDALADWRIAAVNPEGLLHHLHYQRAEKTPYEVECMRKANVLAARGHLAAEAAFRNNQSELDIHHAYIQAMRVRETQLPYNSIVGLNEHGAILHYDHYETEAPSTHRSFLIDAGAYYNGYCADITRTYSKEAEGFFAELIEAMDQAERDIIDEIEVGRSYYDLHVATHHKIAKILHEFGFFKVDANTIYERGYSNAFFPHGLGHFIGLQVHDVGGYLKNPQGESYARDGRHPFLRLRREIEPGHVFTIEPGLYVVDQLLEAFDGNEDFNWQRIAELRPYGGIRIEDSVHVTSNGVENLTRTAFDSLK